MKNRPKMSSSKIYGPMGRSSFCFPLFLFVWFASGQDHPRIAQAFASLADPRLDQHDCAGGFGRLAEGLTPLVFPINPNLFIGGCP